MRELIRQFIQRSWDIIEPRDDAWAAKRELAEALRRLSHLTICSEAPAAVLSGGARAVEAVLAEMEKHDARSFKQCYKDGDYVADPSRFADRAWITGPANPFSPQMVMSDHGDYVEGKLSLDHGYVGAPGWAHGGIVAALLDQLMGFVLIVAGDPCVTQSLSLHYDIPTPSHEELTLRAWIDDDQGRRVVLKGEVRAGDQVTARGEGVFIRLEPKAFGRLLADAAQRAGG